MNRHAPEFKRTIPLEGGDLQVSTCAFTDNNRAVWLSVLSPEQKLANMTIVEARELGQSLLEAADAAAIARGMQR